MLICSTIMKMCETVCNSFVTVEKKTSKLIFFLPLLSVNLFAGETSGRWGYRGSRQSPTLDQWHPDQPQRRVVASKIGLKIIIYLFNDGVMRTTLFLYCLRVRVCFIVCVCSCFCYEVHVEDDWWFFFFFKCAQQFFSWLVILHISSSCCAWPVTVWIHKVPWLCRNTELKEKKNP